TRFSERTPSYDKNYVPPGTQTYAYQSLSARNRLRVAVLPFEQLGKGRHGERCEDLAFSLSRDIPAGLARFRWFDVISPISFTSENLLQREDLDYAIEGIVSRHDRLIQVNVRLLDLTRRTQPLWSERFDLEACELHRLNEMVTGRVVGSIDPVILFIEGQPN